MNTSFTGIKRYICLLTILCLSFLYTIRAAALPDTTISELIEAENDDVKNILQSSLSIVELDKEILQVQDQQKRIEIELAELDTVILEQEMNIEHKQEQAGNILRAYYMGEREGLIGSLLRSSTLQSFLAAIEYIELILKHDKHILTTYIDQFRHLEHTYEQYIEEQEKLNSLEEQLQAQRARVLALEQQVSNQLEGRTDADRIRLLISGLTTFWEEKGLQQVKDYFYELSKAMNQLPAWIQKNSQYFEMKGFKYTISLPDHALNTYLREYDEMFNDFEFSFAEQKITATGKKDDIEITISGYYSIEDEPKHRIHFTVDALYFNGFLLPDYTKEALEEEFDLNFYPSLILSFLRAKSVSISDGQLIIELQLSI